MKSVNVTVCSILCALFLGLLPAAGYGTIVTVAGGGTGDNGPATMGSLLYPSGVAVDGAGNIYIADQGNNRIRQVLAGTGVITTVAGNGTGGYSGDNGAATAAALYGPAGVALDSAGDLYVADQYNNCVRKVSTDTGIITTVAGTGRAGFSGDNGAATVATLNRPTGVAVDSDGNLYIADRGNNRVRKVFAGSGIITTVAGSGPAGYSGDGGAATSATLKRPFGVAVDGSSDIYIADQGNHRIRKVSAQDGIISTVAGNGTAGYSGDNGAATLAALNAPSGIAVGAAGELYVADQGNDRVRMVSLESGIITTVAGSAGSGYSGDKGAAIAARLNHPTGLAVDGAGNLYLADLSNYCIRKVAAGTGIILTVAGGRRGSFSGDGGLSSAARFNLPERVAIDGAGNIFVADSGNNRVRRIAAGTGVISTVAGTGSATFSGENGPATAAGLNGPSAVAIDAGGNIYVADRGNNRIRKVSAQGGSISTVAGNGVSGYSGDNGAAAEAALNAPSGLALDGSGNLYIADRGNHRLRKVSAGTGIITTVAGNGAAGHSGDSGPAVAAQLDRPAGVAVDSAGNIFIADEWNNRVRKINAGSGTIVTVAGNGTAGYSGDNGAATAAGLQRPTGVALDSSGNLYISDQYNLRVRKVSATGIITTVAGNGRLAYAGDNGPATAASLAYPSDIAVTASGKIVIADKGNDCIRVISDDTAKEPDAGKDAAGVAATATAAAVMDTASGTGMYIASALPTGTIIYDSFTSSSTVTLESHTGETGSTWKRIGGSGYGYIDPVNDGLYAKTDVTYANTGAIPSADYSVIATIHSFSSVGGTNQGVCGRVGSQVPSRYFAVFTQGLGWGLYAADGYGNETRIGALYGPRSLTAGRNYKLELRMIGSTISMYVDNVLAATGTNRMSTAAGRAGIETSGAGPGVALAMLDFQVASAITGSATFTLTYSAGANGTISGTTSQRVAYGGSGTQVTAVPNSGYRFVSWSDGVTTASRTDTNVTRNIAVTATFASNTYYTLTYSAGANGTISGSTSQRVAYGGSGTQVTAVPNSGYHFVSWSDGVTTASRIDRNVTRNITVTASFASNSYYTLTYSAGPNGTISGSKIQSVSYGGTGTQVTAVPNTGYYFLSWSDGLATASRIDRNVTRNISVTANFAASTGQTTYIYDSFTASSTVTLESHTGETGSTWKRVGGSGYAYIDPVYDGLYTRTDVTYANTGTIPSADYSVSATIHAFSPSGSTNQGVTGRIGSQVPSRYFAVFTQEMGFGLYAADGFGHETRIGSLYGPRSLTPGREYKLELRMIGSTISMYVDGVLAASGTNTMNSAAGRAGIETCGAGPGAAFEMLDFRVTSPGR